MAPNVVSAIEQLGNLNVIALREKYQQLFGDESKSSSKQFLSRRIAWRLQADAEGGLSERARRRAAEIVDDSDLRTRAPQELLPSEVPANAIGAVAHSQPQRDWRLPPAGTLLTRR